ncbi:MAG: class I SAM-dependent methyltransferase [Verrucomicrobia bacterium]|nr:class I SAM-dependent methyltransferase [Verrucomicrobiota bacterium]
MDTQILCPQCKSISSQKFNLKDLNKKIDDDCFTYYECHKCRLLFVYPIPENLSKYYPPAYYPFSSSLKEFEKLCEGEKYKIDIVQNFLKKGSLLEIGPAMGVFAYLAKQAGFDVETIEMDEKCCQFLSQTLNIPTIRSDDIATAIPSNRSYQIITLWHVVEHLPNPWQVLDRLVGALAPGGFLLLAAPNPHAFQFKLLRSFWAHLDAPRHLEIIPPELLIEFLKDRGCNIVFRTTKDRGALGWNVFGWKHSLSHLLGSVFSPKITHQIGRITSFLLRPIERKEGWGSAYTLVFQKYPVSN